MPEQIGQKNAYVCDKLHVTKTVNVDEGITPFTIFCPVPACGCTARSMFYQVKQELITPEYEFYKPVPGVTLDGWEAQHVEQGGLLMRPAEGVAPLPEVGFDSGISLPIVAQHLAKLKRIFDAAQAVDDAGATPVFSDTTRGYIDQMKDVFSGYAGLYIPDDDYAAILDTVPAGSETPPPNPSDDENTGGGGEP